MADLTEVIPASEWAGRVKASKSEQLHETFASQLRARRLPPFLTEYRFASELVGYKRSKPMKTARAPAWRFDYCWREYMLAVELEGLVVEEVKVKRTGCTRFVLMGGHATPAGFKDDIEKYNAAALLGWTLIRFHQSQVTNGEAVDTTLRLLHAKGRRP